MLRHGAFQMERKLAVQVVLVKRKLMLVDQEMVTRTAHAS